MAKSNSHLFSVSWFRSLDSRYYGSFSRHFKFASTGELRRYASRMQGVQLKALEMEVAVPLYREKSNRNWPHQVGVQKDGNGYEREKEMGSAVIHPMEEVLIRFRQRNYDKADSSTCDLEL